MLCPKGVKRYLQGSHPDRLLTALRRDPAARGGFRSLPYAESLGTVAREIGRLQQAHGPGSVGVLGGASLTTEKTYLLGKFARVCLKTPYIDYNGRLCMVSAGAANKKAFGIDRTTNPWSDMVGTEVIWVAGSNVAECSPITTNYIWQARELGAKVIVQDPRITPLARTCDLYLPVRPGRDAALFAGVLQLMIEQDLIDRAFIAEHTVGFEQVADYCRTWPVARAAEVTGVPERSIRQAAELWGTAKSSFLFHARGIEHHSNGVQNALGTINLVLASGRLGKPKSGYGTIVGQANGQGGREHGQKCDQLPGWRDITNPEHRRHIADIWGYRGARSAGTRRGRVRDVPQDRPRRDQGADLDLLQPEDLAARQCLHHARAREARVLRGNRLLPERHRMARRHRAAGQSAGGGRRYGHPGRGQGDQDQQSSRGPGRGTCRLDHHPGHRSRARATARLQFQ
jgi:assimilatory nitrate reductase catalytic subunit